MSIKALHAGDGYTYLLRGIADAEGTPGASPMSRYYAEAGHPPGQWTGTGLHGLAAGAGLPAGERVTEKQMERLFKDGTDPVTDVPLGRRHNAPRPWRERADARIHALPLTLTATERSSRIAAIETEERARLVHRPVAGFDCVFSPSKSVSTLWALADPAARDQIADAHHEVVAEVLRVMERDVARTRVGTDGVAQVETRGVIAAMFDHYESRAGDPQLHSHVVIANRVQGPDGKWRTLDSRGSLFPAAVAMSELYDTLLADQLTARLGVRWERRGNPVKPKNQSWEIAGVPDELLKEFSQRAKGIEAVKDELIAAYRETHGRDPDDATIIRLRQQATYATRPAKQMRSLAQMSEQWRARAARFLTTEPKRWTTAVITRSANIRRSVLRAGDIEPLVEQLAGEALEELNTERSTWRTWNVRAAAARASMPYRMATASDRHALIDAITRRVIQRSVNITPPELAVTPHVFRRADGTSAFRRTHGDIYTTADILAAEDRLLAAANTLTAPTVDKALISRAVTTPTTQGLVATADQSFAAEQIAISGRLIDVLVGAAGSGKTSTLAALRTAWEAQHGPGSVIGLAPSAVAAEVLADSLGIATENAAKWLYESTGPAAHRRAQTINKLNRRRRSARIRGKSTPRLDAVLLRLADESRRWSFHAGQLVIVDESSLAGTHALDALRAQAEHAGAKLLLVGDWAQLSAVEAGGAFGMLVRERGAQLPELTGVHRFIHAWERTASLQLRTGDVSVVDTYLAHGRVHSGDDELVIDAAYQAWRSDQQSGYRSLLIAADASTVRNLNELARADLASESRVEPAGVPLHDGTHAGVGDHIITRHNDRTLATGPHSWVKNGDHWIVHGRPGNRSLLVARPNGGTIITLPADYVAEHVELAYATTAHRAQGTTVDTAHAIISGKSRREALYVAMTRGRRSNTAYVITDVTEDEIPDNQPRDARDILIEVIQRNGAELSARETITHEQNKATTIAQLAAEYETIAREAATGYWAGILNTCPLPHTARNATTSPSYPALVTAMRHAEAAGLDPAELMPQLADHDELKAAADPLDVLHHRLSQVTDHAAATRPARGQRRLIAGLIPEATHVADPEMRRALDERAALIDQRAQALAHQAIADRAPWLTDLGSQPTNPPRRDQWRQHVATVAAYRERHNITDPTAIGTERMTRSRRTDRRRAQTSIAEAQRLSRTTRPDRPTRRPHFTSRAPHLTTRRLTTSRNHLPARDI